jgi:hypothetical protein
MEIHVYGDSSEGVARLLSAIGATADSTHLELQTKYYSLTCTVVQEPLEALQPQFVVICVSDTVE